MRSFILPPSPPREAVRLQQTPAAALASTQPDHPPSQSITAKPSAVWAKVPAAINRMRASFASAEAVHQARLDRGFSGPERHLLVRYTSSAK
ncbi:hypothetical protein ACFFON_01375 [Arthrobacter citreus]|uniref:hypothetical protein n=1 Tax=Arthrobacter TaxID=1663 RepID=UPI001265904B|nr:hypothetical protein [Arthrobacter gandavensis]